MDKMQAIRVICRAVRDDLVARYGKDCLYGTCIEASERICSNLKRHNIEAKIVEGWCHYDDASSCSDRDYDEHTWVEATIDGKMLYLDVTADQFQFYIDEEIPNIIIGEKPYYMVYEEPVTVM